MSSAPYKATWGSWWGAWAPLSLWMVWSLCWMSTAKTSRFWTPWIRNFSNYEWLTKKFCQSRGCASWDTSKSLWPHPQKGSCQTILLNWSKTTSIRDCLTGWRWWWPTSRQLLMRRHILIFSSHSQTADSTRQAGLRQWASSLYKS